MSGKVGEEGELLGAWQVAGGRRQPDKCRRQIFVQCYDALKSAKLHRPQSLSEVSALKSAAIPAGMCGMQILCMRCQHIC